MRKDKWPGKLEKWADQEHKGTVGYLAKNDYDEVMQELLKSSTGRNAKNRVLDPVGLSVISVSDGDGKVGCMDFRTVTTKNNKHAKRMEPNEMTVVYPRTSDGKALRYVIEYNSESDEVTVMTQQDFTDKTQDNWTGSEVWR